MKQKSEWTRTVALCVHMNVGYFLVRPNARWKKKASALNQVRRQKRMFSLFNYRPKITIVLTIGRRSKKSGQQSCFLFGRS
jgi:hypothetical protein